MLNYSDSIREYDITVIEGRAPEPILGITVSQNNTVIGSDLNVQPGTKLQMKIFLDPNSTSTYGLRVSYMDVTDRKTKEETIILNGYAPHLFIQEKIVFTTWQVILKRCFFYERGVLFLKLRHS